MKNLDDLIYLCIPQKVNNDPLIHKGYDLKKRWIKSSLQKFGSIAKIAYVNEKPVGMIQFLPDIETHTIEITCIFVPIREQLQKGIGRSLLDSLINDLRNPVHKLSDLKLKAIVTWAFDVPGWFSQKEFFQKSGFIQAHGNDPYLLYYPLTKGYTHRGAEKYIPQKEEENKILIFRDSSCPFAIPFQNQMIKLIQEIAQNIPIIIIDKYENPLEYKKRGKVPSCAVNKKPIMSFVVDAENFKDEVKSALASQE